MGSRSTVATRDAYIHPKSYPLNFVVIFLTAFVFFCKHGQLVFWSWNHEVLLKSNYKCLNFKHGSSDDKIRSLRSGNNYSPLPPKQNPGYIRLRLQLR